MAVISWKERRPVDETKGWLKKATDQGDFTLSNRLSIRYPLLCLTVLTMQYPSSAGNAETEIRSSARHLFKRAFG
jgi:hypothetical protein